MIDLTLISLRSALNLLSNLWADFIVNFLLSIAFLFNFAVDIWEPFTIVFAVQIFTFVKFTIALMDRFRYFQSILKNLPASEDGDKRSNSLRNSYRTDSNSPIYFAVLVYYTIIEYR